MTLLRRPPEQAAWLQLVEQQPRRREGGMFDLVVPGGRLQRAPEGILKDPEVVTKALEQRGDVLCFAARELRGDPRLVLLAMRWSPEAGR